MRGIVLTVIDLHKGLGILKGGSSKEMRNGVGRIARIETGKIVDILSEGLTIQSEIIESTIF